MRSAFVTPINAVEMTYDDVCDVNGGMNFKSCWWGYKYCFTNSEIETFNAWSKVSGTIAGLTAVLKTMGALSGVSAAMAPYVGVIAGCIAVNLAIFMAINAAGGNKGLTFNVSWLQLSPNLTVPVPGTF